MSRSRGYDVISSYHHPLTGRNPTALIVQCEWKIDVCSMVTWKEERLAEKKRKNSFQQRVLQGTPHNRAPCSIALHLQYHFNYFRLLSSYVLTFHVGIMSEVWFHSPLSFPGLVTSLWISLLLLPCRTSSNKLSTAGLLGQSQLQ